MGSTGWWLAGIDVLTVKVQEATTRYGNHESLLCLKIHATYPLIGVFLTAWGLYNTKCFGKILSSVLFKHLE